MLAVAAVSSALVTWILSPKIEPPRRHHRPPPRVVQTVPKAPQVAVLGFVSLENGPTLHERGKLVDVEMGQRIETHAGSHAAIQLSGDAHLGIGPRSQVHIAESSKGERLVLSKGNARLSVNVHQRTLDNKWTVATPGAELTVSTTSLGKHYYNYVDILLIEKPNGRKQIRASVEHGRAELAAAGCTVVLLPNMEGVVDEGKPARIHSQTAEVDEINRMIEQTETLAAKSGAQAGAPSIVEFNGYGKPIVWTVFPVPNPTDTELTRCQLPLPTSTEILGVYSLDGVKGNYWPYHTSVNLSNDPVPPGGETSVIVKYSGQRGLFESVGDGTHEFNSLPGEADALSLIQFRLPASARVEELTPAAIETRNTLSRLALTIPIRGRSFDTVIQPTIRPLPSVSMAGELHSPPS